MPLMIWLLLLFRHIAKSLDDQEVRLATGWVLRLLIAVSSFKAFAHLLDPAADPTCSMYLEEPQTVEHRLQRYSNLNVLLQPPLGVLTTNPKNMLEAHSRTLGARLTTIIR